jgi:hypothetical protein
MIASLTLVLLLTSAATTLAVTDVRVYIDGWEVRTDPELLHVRRGEDHVTAELVDKPSRYDVDIQPEIVSGQVFVSARAMSEYFDANVVWQKPKVIIRLEEVSLTFTIDSRVALHNGNELLLDIVPYIKNGRTMVPLRIICEAFGCYVNYRNGEVHIVTEALRINDTKVASVQRWNGMFMGGFLYESTTNLCVSEMYQQLLNNCADNEIEPPVYYGKAYNTDMFTYFYYLSSEVSFMETAGLAGVVIQQYDVYERINDDPDFAYLFPDETNKGVWLIHDVTQDKWYRATDDFNYYWQKAFKVGDWELIFNNAL